MLTVHSFKSIKGQYLVSTVVTFAPKEDYISSLIISVVQI